MLCIDAQDPLDNRRSYQEFTKPLTESAMKQRLAKLLLLLVMPIKSLGLFAMDRDHVPAQKILLEDGQEMEISRAFLEQSGTLKVMMEDLDADKQVIDAIPIYGGISPKVMSALTEYVKTAHAGTAEGLSKFELLWRIYTMIIEYKGFDIINILEQLRAAEYLNIPLLYQALCLVVAHELPKDKEHKLLYKVVKEWRQDIQKAALLFFRHNHKHIHEHEEEDLGPDGILKADWDYWDVSGYIRFLAAKNDADLQATLDTLSKHATQASIEAHKALVGYVLDLSQKEMQDKFKEFHGPSSLSMAIQLIYSSMLDEEDSDFDHTPASTLDLDPKLGCASFAQKLKQRINVPNFDPRREGQKLRERCSFSCLEPKLFSKQLFPFLLPLIPATAPLFSVENTITSLDLYDIPLTTIPDSIANLSDLEVLMLDPENLTSIPDNLSRLTNLKKLHLGRIKLTRCLDEGQKGWRCNIDKTDALRIRPALRSMHISEYTSACKLLKKLPKSFGEIVNPNELPCWAFGN